jgi:hypothetical protein
VPTDTASKPPVAPGTGAEPAPLPAATVEKPAPAADFKKINIGFGMRVGARVQNQNDPSKMNDLRLDELNIEARFSGQIHPMFAWQANFNGFLPGAGSPGQSAQANVLDLIAKFEPHSAFHLWAGRMLVPSDRSNFSGPWFMSPWVYTGASFPARFVGPHTGPFGRDDGVTAWGEFVGGKAKYYAGAYNLNDGTISPLYSGRLNFCLLGDESGFYHSSTYYGAKDIVALGLGGQYQKNASVMDPSKPYSLFNADLLAEKNLGAGGVVTFEGGYYRFPQYYSALTPDPTMPLVTTPVVKNSFYVLGSWLTPSNIGIGKIQPLVRYQQTTDPNWKVLDVQATYVVNDYFLRTVVGYEYTNFGGGTSGNALLAGVQIQP